MILLVEHLAPWPDRLLALLGNCDGINIGMVSLIPFYVLFIIAVKRGEQVGFINLDNLNQTPLSRITWPARQLAPSLNLSSG
ncbi:hypothetical protein [Aestuariivivens sediminis]|uniref:hypothetical protein n=1 Tax=Aestuariivivens sediminis TaxID=2913557 RepID=UPI001F5A0D19|nr:hypothetical protein [Aestuariivivens sediminis]